MHRAGATGVGPAQSQMISVIGGIDHPVDQIGISRYVASAGRVCWSVEDAIGAVHELEET